MRSRLLRVTANIVVIGVGSLSLVACSSDKAKTTETTAAATETTAAAAGETTTAAPAASEAPTTTVAAAAAAAAPAGASNVSAANGDIFYQAVGAGSFLTLAKLINDAGLMDTIKSAGPFTVFAPTDAAFAAVPKDALAAIAADKAKLTKVLLYHVVPGRISSTELKTGDTKTAEGSALKITANAGVVTVNDASVIAANVGASNGVIHVIDKVLLPPDL